MENLAPILIGLIWLAYKYFQKSQKNAVKKQSSQNASRPVPVQTPAENSTGKEFEEYIQQFFGVPSTVAVKPVSQTQSQDVNSYMDKGDAPDVDVSYESIEYQDSEEYQKESHKISQIIQTPRQMVHPLIEDFDLKKAIIYSEILKPKYF